MSELMCHETHDHDPLYLLFEILDWHSSCPFGIGWPSSWSMGAQSALSSEFTHRPNARSLGPDF
jgi:hypothetical protein